MQNPSAPLVSVVVSVFNGERYLEESLETVLSQEGVDFECVVVDDGSTDRSPVMLKALAARDTRVRLLRQENRGLTRALVYGCKEARGLYIARHDADDVSRPGRLAKQATALDREPSLSMVGSWAGVIGPEDEEIEVITRGKDLQENRRRLLGRVEGPAGHGSMMFRRRLYDSVGGYQPAFRFAQDKDLWLRLIDVGELQYLQERLYDYRIEANSISQTRRKLQWELADLAHLCSEARIAGSDEQEVLNKAMQLSSGAKAPIWGMALNYLSRHEGAYYLGSRLLQNDDSASVRYFKKAFSLAPWDPRVWVRLVEGMGRWRSAPGDSEIRKEE